MPKTHALLDGSFGLFENAMTACGMAGQVDKKDTLIHHQTRAKYVLADYPTCKTCETYLQDHFS